MKKLVTLIILFFISFGHAQDGEVSFTALVSKKKLGINQRLRVEFKIENKDGDNFTRPDFKGFRLISGPAQQVSTNWINGVRSFSRSYSFILQPMGKGKLTIGQATIEVDGTVYKTAPVEIEVTEAVDDPNAITPIDQDISDKLILVADVSDTSPYVNEGISVVYKLYVATSIGISNFDVLDDPKYSNFWSQDIKLNGLQFESTMYKGQRYRMLVLKKELLYPQQSGKLELEPLVIDVSVELPSNKRNFFGQRVMVTDHKTVSTGARTINVKALPEEGKPESFTGAVGQFNFNVTISRDSLKASEALNAELKVSGKGNLKLFSLPKLTTPSALETYDPEHKEDVDIRMSGMQGSISDNYTIVSRYKGKYPIPTVAFSYFDPKTGTYKTVASGEREINVTDGPVNNAATVPPVNNAPGKQMVVAQGSDFRFIKTTPDLVPISKTYFYKSLWFYLLLTLPLLVIPIAIITKNKREAFLADVQGDKIRKANKLAKKYLSAARKTLGQKEAFYIAMEKALHNYLKAKLHIETSEFSKEKIADLLADKGVENETIEGFVGLLKSCEFARYSPASDVTMQHDYDNAATIITKIDKQI
ncbi:BatD family protein [Neptunitalea chrysea]|nr:BatD family protein [Neptunitalea chrysea]